jgi:hypothetical protein
MNTPETQSGGSLKPVGSARQDKHVQELHNLGNDLEEWCEIRVRKDSIPRGARLVEAYATAREIIVMGWPSQNDDDESHNCDAMGCGSVGRHVIYRLPLPNAAGEPQPRKPRT